MKHLIAGIALALAAMPAGAEAQALLPGGFTSLPAFAWPEIDPETGGRRWDGAYGRVSTGFAVSSSRHFGTQAGPTIGIEGGRLWRQGDLVVGLSGGMDYLSPFGSASTPSFGRIGYTRDFAGGVSAKVGALVREDVLVYTRVGLGALNETLRFGASPLGPGFSRSDVVVRPDAAVGLEWAVTDKLTVGFEVGATGRALR